MTDEEFLVLTPPERRVTLDNLARWPTTLLGESTMDGDEQTPDLRSKFPFDPALNQKIILWHGNIVELDVDAIVSSTNEAMTDRSGVCGQIFDAAGRGLDLEVQKLEGCRTGEVKQTKGFNLPARFVFHTVGPRFNQKYKTAAENALHNCYRNCLQLLKEQGLSTIGFCVINSDSRGYPREDGCHIASRTIRRFLEHYGSSIDTVVICVNRNEDFEIYNRILPLYFPRSIREETLAIKRLPEDTGNELGETVFEERKIRISAFPGAPDSDEEEEEDVPIEKAAPVTLTALQEDPDSNAKSFINHDPEAEEEEMIYHRYLRRAKSEDLSDIARMNIIYQSGKDTLGRPIVVVIGSHLPMSTSSSDIQAVLERVLLYIIRIMDPIVEKEYLLVYIHSNMKDEQQPEFAWLRNVYNIWDRKYSHNLRGLYIVSPTFWLKLFVTLLRPLLSNAFLDKMVYFDDIVDLLRVIDQEQLKLPPALFSGARLPSTKTFAPSSEELPHSDL